MDKYFKLWPKPEEIFSVDSTRTQPALNPNPKKNFSPTRTRKKNFSQAEPETEPDPTRNLQPEPSISLLKIVISSNFLSKFFFFFSFQILFLLITILYTEQEKVLLQKKCYFKKSITSEKVLFHFIILHLKQCRTNENGASKMQKFLLLWPPVLWYFCLFFNQKPFWGKFEH